MAGKELTPEENRKYYLYLGIMIITGACNTIFLKLQNKAYENLAGSPFVHPWLQSVFMFIGESYCAIIWLIFKKRILDDEKAQLEKEGKEDNRPEPPIYLFLITCVFDVIGTTLLNFALIMMPASIFQMLRGGVIIFTNIFSVLFLKKFPKNYQYLGIVLAFLGVFLVGLSSQIHADSSQSTSLLGIIMLIASLIFTGFQFVFQEIYISKYKTSPIQLVAWEGMWGLAIFAVLLPIFQFIPCGFSGDEDVCSNAHGSKTLENTPFAFEQIFSHAPMIFYVLLQTISIGLFNYFGITITKFASSATRSIMDSARNVLIWIFFLFVPTSKGTESFFALQLCGFVIMILGQLIYNQLVTVNMFDLDVHHKNKILGLSESESSETERPSPSEEPSHEEHLLKTKDSSSIKRDI